jgi:iron complex outermembrane receptor protein
MKKLFFLGALFVSTSIAAQTTVTGTIYDAEMNAPLPGANIIEKGTNNGVVSDFNGKFTLTSIATSGAVVVSYVGYAPMTFSFNGSVDLGTVSLESNSLDAVIVIGSGIIDLADDRKTPVAVSTIRAAEIQARGVGNVEFTEVMKNSPSVYVSNQAGGFGDSQMFTRGFSQSNTAFLLNGQPINGMEDGRMYWSNWSGMSDVANAVQIQRGLGSSKLAISSVGGTINIVSKTTDKKEGGYVRFLSGNGSYFKTTAAYDSGLKESGWAYSLLIDHWQADRKFANGTQGQGQNYFFSLGYKASERSNFNFLITGAPQWHHQNFSKSRATYEEFGELTNSNIGWYNGERFSERRNYYHKPIANLNWDYEINDSMDLSTVLYASWGRGGGTGNLGSSSNRIRFDNDEINFDAIEENNIANSDVNGNGTFGSGYLRRSSVNNHNWYGLVSNLKIDNGSAFTYNVGFDFRTYTGDHFRQIEDFIGLNGYNDSFGTTRPSDYVITDSFAANPWSALFDFADDSQRYSYNYSETINYLGGFGQVEYASDDYTMFVQGALSTQSYQRMGGAEFRGPGDSEKVEKLGYNLKAGMSFNLTDNSSFFFNAGKYSRQPFLDNIFTDVRNSNELVNNGDVQNERISGLEAGYRYEVDGFRVNLDVYSTKWGNRYLEFFGGTDEVTGIDTFYRFSGVNQVHNGLEFEVDYRPFASDITFNVFGSFGNWKYNESTPYQVWEDDGTGQILAEQGELQLTDVKVGQAPQTSFGFGATYKVNEKFSVDAQLNAYSDFYGFVDVADVVESGLDGTPYQSEKLNSYELFDLGWTYKFQLAGQDLVFRSNIYNLFDKNYVNQKDAYGYFLGNGTTWNASLRYAF